MARWLSGVALALAVGGCGGSDNSTEAPTAPYRLLLNDHQIMDWVVDPAADVIWLAVGYVITEAGERNLAPTSEAGWAEVRNAAATMAESGNLLMLPGRSKGPDWNEFARGIVAMGERAIAAAEARDEQALLEVGGQLYNVCVACHQIYMASETHD